jgi:hypothetical protein
MSADGYDQGGHYGSGEITPDDAAWAGRNMWWACLLPLVAMAVIGIVMFLIYH